MRVTDDGPAAAGRRASAVFKYGLLRRFPVAFATRVGAWSAGRRAVFLDGYPGPGQLADGSPGSPLLVARGGDLVAQESGGSITGIFVESDRSVFANLRGALATHTEFDYRLFAGELADHLPGILRLVPDSALFAMLDPGSTALDRDQLTGQLLARGLAPTEVLVHLDVRAVARIGGILRSSTEEYRIPDEVDTRTIDYLDRFLGGQWWHREAITVPDADDLGRAGRAATRIAGRFAQHVTKRTGFRSVILPVRLRPAHQPTALLMFFAKGRDGFWQFADTVGQAGLDWYEHWQAEQIREQRRCEERAGQMSLFGLDDDPLGAVPDTRQRHHEAQWVSAIERNIVRLLGEHGPFTLADRVSEVYGDTLGLAGAAHVRQAVRTLHDDGLLAQDGSDDRYYSRPLRLASSSRRSSA